MAFVFNAQLTVPLALGRQRIVYLAKMDFHYLKESAVKIVRLECTHKMEFV